MTKTSNRQVLLAARPNGLPINSDWKIVETSVPEISAGQILVKNKFYTKLDTKVFMSELEKIAAEFLGKKKNI